MPAHTTLSRMMGPEPAPNVLSMPRTEEPGLKRQKKIDVNFYNKMPDYTIRCINQICQRKQAKKELKKLMHVSINF